MLISVQFVSSSLESDTSITRLLNVTTPQIPNRNLSFMKMLTFTNLLFIENFHLFYRVRIMVNPMRSRQQFRGNFEGAKVCKAHNLIQGDENKVYNFVAYKKNSLALVLIIILISRTLISWER